MTKAKRASSTPRKTAPKKRAKTKPIAAAKPDAERARKMQDAGRAFFEAEDDIRRLFHLVAALIPVFDRSENPTRPQVEGAMLALFEAYGHAEAVVEAFDGAFEQLASGTVRPSERTDAQ